MRKLLLLCILSVMFVSLAHASDRYPWINTALYAVSKDPASYTTAESNFVADHYDLAVGHFQMANTIIKQRNPDTRIVPFGIITQYFGTTAQAHYLDYIALHPEYTYAQKESAFLHYKCDTYINGKLIKGCNVANNETGTCTGSAAASCSVSTASRLEESRVPDPDSYYQNIGVNSSNVKSETFKEFAIWMIKEQLGWYPQLYPAAGMFWDNIIYVPGYVGSIQNTIEYFGQPEPQTGEHQRNIDYHNFYNEVKQRVEQETGRSLIWIVNGNNMFWIKSDGPYISWILQNTDYFTPEGWVSPIQYGEYTMPVWGFDCKYLKDLWNYTNFFDKKVFVAIYNQPFNGSYSDPDERTKIFSIGKFYLVSNPNLYYYYSEDSRQNNFLYTQWNEMAEVNLGQPRQNLPGVKDIYGQTNTNRFFDWAKPTTTLDCTYFNWSEVVTARYFDNGLVLVRWKGQRWWGSDPIPAGPDFNSYVDPRTYHVNNSYENSYYIIQEDGTLSSKNVSTVTLRTNEAVVLLRACSEGAVSGACGCNGAIKNDGDYCNYSTTLPSSDNETRTCSQGLVGEECLCGSALVQPDGQLYCCSGVVVNPCDTGMNCNDNDAATTDACINPSSCNAFCQHTQQCANNSGVCESACSWNNDNDCPACINNDDLCPQACDVTNDNDCSQECMDNDNDGYYRKTTLCSTGTDCDDSRANVNPAAQEICGNSIDDNCDSVDTQCMQCTLEGQEESCLISGCPGKQTCIGGYISACIKDDICCGINCDDKNSCTYDMCNNGLCINTRSNNCEEQFNMRIEVPARLNNGQYFAITVTDNTGRPVYGARAVYGIIERTTNRFGKANFFAKESVDIITIEYNGVQKSVELDFGNKINIDKDTIITIALAMVVFLIVAAMARGRSKEI